MKDFLKRLNINDFLLLLLGLVIILPYKAYPFLIGHIYIHEIIIFIYFMINVILIIVTKEIKNVLRISDIQKIFLIFVGLVLINYIFSLNFLRKLSGDDFIKGVKIHINVLRGYTEFVIILVFFIYNLKRSGIKANGFLYYIAVLAIIDMIVPVVKLSMYVNIDKLITEPGYFMKFRVGIGRPANVRLPDGASAIIFLGVANYLFFIFRKWWLKIFLLMFSFISFIVIFVTYARIYTLGLFAIILFGFLFLYNKKIKLAIIILTLLFFMLGGFNAIKGRFFSLQNISSKSGLGSGRFLLINSVNDIFRSDINNMIYGIGSGNYFYYNKKLVKVRPFNIGFSGPHNQLFTILTDFGLLGYLLFIYSILFLYYKNFKIISVATLKEKVLRKNLLGFVLAFLLMGIAGDMFVSYHPPMTHYLMFLWMFLSILSSEVKIWL